MLVISLMKVQQTVSGERGNNVTMLAFICADGSSIPPTFIFPRKKMYPELYNKGPSGCVGFPSETGNVLKNTFSKVVLTTLLHLFKAGRPARIF